MSFKLSGWSSMKANITSVAHGTKAETGEALREEMLIEGKESQRLVPYKTGRLHDSMVVTDWYVKGNSVKVDIVYTAEYAKIVHEDLHAFHPNGQAKYLEQPLRESSPYMGARVARRIDMRRMAG